jgi:hypothetical protein
MFAGSLVWSVQHHVWNCIVELAQELDHGTDLWLEPIHYLETKNLDHKFKFFR